MSDSSCESEAALIRQTLSQTFIQNWEGKSCVGEMRQGGSRNWRQTEWIGWYFEWKAFERLTSAIGGGIGPTYNSTEYDYKRDCVWDFKTHVSNSGRPWAILNDSNSVNSCIEEYGSVGFIIAAGPAMYNDVTLSFKKWHSELGGDPSAYVRKGVKTGQPSRRRKTLFVFTEIVMFRFDTDVLARGQSEKWIRGFQKGMPNSNGKPRPSKIQIHLGKMPPELLMR